MTPVPTGPPEPLLRDYLDVLRRRSMTIAACLFLGAALGLLAGISRPAVFTSQATVLLLPVPSDQAASVGGKSRAVNLETQRSLIRSQPVAGAAAQALGEASFKTVRQSTRVGVDAASDVLKINYTADSAEGARDGAEAVAVAYLEYRRGLALDVVDAERQRTQTQVEELQGQLEDVAGRLAEFERPGIRLTQTQREERATLSAREEILKQQLIALRNDLFGPEVSVEPGRVIDEPTLPSGKGQLQLPFLGGAALGLVIGLFMAFMRDRLDGSFRVARASSSVGRRVVATVPVVPPGARVHLDAPTDGHRRLGLTLLSLDHGQRKAVVVADIDGTDWTAPVAIAQVGALLARTEHPVVVIDGDLAAGVITEAMGFVGYPGVGDFTTPGTTPPALPGASVDADDDASASVARRRPATRRAAAASYVQRVEGLEGLGVIPRGVPGASVDVLLSGRFRQIVGDLGAQVDVVIVAAPALTSSSIAIGLASELDGLVLVVRPDSPVSRIEEAAADLERLGGRLLAIIEAVPLPTEKAERSGLAERLRGLVPQRGSRASSDRPSASASPSDTLAG